MPVLDLQEIQQKLEKQKSALLARLQKQEKTNEAGQSINPDRSDLASRYRQQNRDQLLLARAEQQLAEVEQALERLAAGIYGECTQCGKPVRPERLIVMPAAALCIQCQQGEEQHNH